MYSLVMASGVLEIGYPKTKARGILEIGARSILGIGLRLGVF